MHSYLTERIHFPSYKTLELFRHDDTSNLKSNEIVKRGRKAGGIYQVGSNEGEDQEEDEDRPWRKSNISSS